MERRSSASRAARPIAAQPLPQSRCPRAVAPQPPLHSRRPTEPSPPLQPPTPSRRRSPAGSLAGGDPLRDWHRPLPWALVLSVVVHLALLLGVGAGVRRGTVAAAADSPERDPLRFELVETPESAATEETRESDLLSNRTTRSQEPSPERERPVTGSPDLPQRGESHDLRPEGTAPRLGPTRPPAPAPRAPSRASPPQVRQQAREPTREQLARTESSGIQLPEESAPRRPPAAPPGDTEPAPEEQRPTAEARPGPSRQPRPPRPPAEPSRTEPAPPTAFQLDDSFRPGRPSLTPAEEEALARAEAEGEFSFEATQHFFADYFLHLRREIENTWVLLLMTRYTGLEPSRAVVDFQILPDGSVRGLAVRSGEGDEEIFPLVCTMAVRNAGPFPPVPYDSIPQLPPEARDLPLRVRVNFNYR